MRNIVVVVFLLSMFLYACGGGSSDSAPNTNNGNITSPGGSGGSTSTTYTGKTAVAKIDAQSAHDIVYHTSTISDLSNALMFGDEHQQLRFDALSTPYITGSSSDCETGSITLNQVNDTDATANYDQCTTGPFTIDGSGMFSVSQFSPNGDAELGVLSFESLSVTKSLIGLRYTVIGDIQLNFDDVEESATFNVLIKESSYNTQYLLQGYRVSFSRAPENKGYSLSGRLYIGEHGYVDVNTTQKSYVDPQARQATALVVIVKGSNSLLLETASTSKLNVSLYLNDQPENTQQISVAYDYYVNRAFERTTNSMPEVSFVLASADLAKNQAIVFNASASNDIDDDFIIYNWSISTQPENAQVSLQGNGFPLLTFSTDIAGDYEITLTGNDTSVSGNTETLAFTVKQDPPQININAQSTINYAQDYAAEITRISPPDDGVFSYELYFGPTGMLLTQDKEVVWNGSAPKLGEDLNVNYALKVSNQDHEVIFRHSVQVIDTVNKPAVYLNANEIDQRSFIWADVNDNGFKELIFMRGGTIEAWDFSQPNASLLWQYGLGFDSIKSVTYIANDNALAIVPNTGTSLDPGLYQFNINTKIVSKIHENVFASSNEAIVTNIIGDDKLELITNFGLYDYQTGEVLQNFDGSNSSAVEIGDFNGDGQKDIAFGLTIFSGADFSLLVDISNDEPGVQSFSSAFYDFNKDGQDEFITSFKRYDDEAQRTDHRLYVYQFENGQAVEKLTLLTEEDSNIDFLVTEGGIIYAKGSSNQIHRLMISEDLSSVQREIASISADVPNAVCRLESVENMTLFLYCDVFDEEQQKSDFFISKTNWSEGFAALPVTLDMNNDEFYGNMQQQDKQVSVSAASGIYVFDDEKNINFLERGNSQLAAPALGYYPSIDNHVIQSGQVQFWNQFYDSKIDVIGLQHNTVGEVYLDIKSSSYPNEIIPLNINGGYMLFDNQNSLYFINQATFAIDYVLNDTPSEGANSIRKVKEFTKDDIEYVAVWKEEALLLFEYNGTFSLTAKLSLPDSFDYNPNAYLMEHIINDGRNALVLIQNYKHHVIIDLETLELATQELTFDDATTLSFRTDKSCVTRINQTDTKNAYVATFNLAVNEPDLQNHFRRQPKLVEYDLINNEIIWASNNFSGKFDMFFDVICSEIDGRQSLSLSSTYQVISTN